MPKTTAGVAAVLLAGLPSVALAQDAPFVQDRIAIGLWVDPPIDDSAEARYAELAEANFTVVIGGFAAGNEALARRQLALCEEHDLRVVLPTAGLPPDRLPDGPACWGYVVRDEPSAADFASLHDAVQAIERARPGRFAYINLFPNYANQTQLGTATYEEHVSRFVDEVGVQVLSMDHYPLFLPNADGRQAYCDNLDVMRRYSLAKGIPFWNFFNTMPFGPHSDPTEAQLRWQIYTSLAYGAKGVLYFCYWTPRGGEFPKGGAIITAEGRRTRHYDQAKRINAAVKALGPTLMRLTSTSVVRVRGGDDPAATTAGSPVIVQTPGEYLIGVFSHADGRRAALLCNYEHAYTAWPTVELDAPEDQVREVSQETGEEVAVIDDSPDMDGLQISLDAGSGRLFLLP